ncbi:hypothetical protein BLOT_001111 [Blomia tropicalis]|nr:hypothetical protein BLOT_001111 [Blomia tropicalis]
MVRLVEIVLPCFKIVISKFKAISFLQFISISKANLTNNKISKATKNDIINLKCKRTFKSKEKT